MANTKKLPVNAKNTVSVEVVNHFLDVEALRASGKKVIRKPGVVYEVSTERAKCLVCRGVAKVAEMRHDETN